MNSAYRGARFNAAKGAAQVPRSLKVTVHDCYGVYSGFIAPDQEEKLQKVEIPEYMRFLYTILT